jgi:predicted MFS family arabinose efflux permease
MGIFHAGLLAPVAIGPVIGGAISGSLGWKAIFWFLTIYAAIFLALLILLLPETLRSLVSNGSHVPSNWLARHPLLAYRKHTNIPWESEEQVPTSAKKVDVLGPLRILATRYATPIIIFLAIYYAVWQMSITAMSSLFEAAYGLSETEIGLTFIANGVGSIIGTLTTGKILDIDYRRVKAEYEAQTSGSDSHEDASFPLEKARLRLVPVFALLQCASIALFGWTLAYAEKVHIAVPIVSTFVTGWTAVSTQSVVMTYLVDVFSPRNEAASASASLNLARCLFAAGGTSFIMPMVNKVGVGLAFTICIIVQFVALVGVAVQWKFASAWRIAAERRMEVIEMEAKAP